MGDGNMNPSDFTSTFPYNSVFHKLEPEKIAMNIMDILSKSGDKFRKLSYADYTPILENHEWEREWFTDVVDYCSSKEKAKSFSPEWNNIMDKYELLIEKNKLDAWLRAVEQKTYYNVRYSQFKVDEAEQVIKNMQGIIEEIYYLVEKARMKNKNE